MAGIYVHVPFCKQACHYCDFHFSTSVKGLEKMVDAIAIEMSLKKELIPNERIETIYFGGGTPSLLSHGHLEKLVDHIADLYKLSSDVEYTLEANPDDLNRDKLEAFAEIGINRLSIGIQSFSDAYLKWMNRAHTSAEAVQSVILSKECGIVNLSIDLIYGLPQLKLAFWKDEILRAIDLGVMHISAYCLTIEPGTALGSRVVRGKERAVDEYAAAEQMEMLIDILANEGLQQYEISNFAKPGFHSRHNMAYWHGIPYLGFGPSAHSFFKGQRFWNVANNAQYLKAIQAQNIPESYEVLSKANLINERIMTGFRTIYGLDIEALQADFGYDLIAAQASEIKKLTLSGHLVIDGPMIRLTRKGLLLADGIAASLFKDEPIIK